MEAILNRCTCTCTCYRVQKLPSIGAHVHLHEYGMGTILNRYTCTCILMNVLCEGIICKITKTIVSLFVALHILQLLYIAIIISMRMRL